jgi:hypothetical protein
MKIIHIVNQNKFVHRFAVGYERVFPGKNIHLIRAQSNNEGKESDNCFRVSDSNLYNVFRKSKPARGTIVFLHALDRVKLALGLRLLNEGIPVVPIIYGGESLPLTGRRPEHCLYPRTSELYLKNLTVTERLKRNISTILPTRMAMSCSGFTWMALRLLKQVPVISGPLAEEVEDIVSFNNLNCKYLRLLPGGIEHIHDVSSPMPRQNETKCQLGHASNFINNHLDSLDYLKHKRNLREVIIPLSYGDLRYRELLLPHIERELGSVAYVLKNYMPTTEYFAQTRNVSQYIALQQIQFGLANIHSALFYGSTVFLPSNNPISRRFARVGIKVIPCEMLFESGNRDLPVLSASEREANREIIIETNSSRIRDRQLKESLCWLLNHYGIE